MNGRVPRGLRSASVTATVACGVSLLLANPIASAQTQQIATRRVLLEQAQQADGAGDHRRALELAQAAARIEMTPSVRLFIAGQQLALGQYAAAAGTAELCVREVSRDRAVANADAILARCTALQSDARRRTGTLTFRVSGDRPNGLVVTVEGSPIDESLIGLPTVVSAGSISVSARAEGRAPCERNVEVNAGANVDVSCDFGTADSRTATSGPVNPDVAASAAPGSSTTNLGSQTSSRRSSGSVMPPPPRREVRAGRRGVSVPAIVVMSGGLALGLGGGLAFYALRQGALGSCEVRSDEILCPTELARVQAEGAYTHNTMANLSIALGSAVAVGGLVWTLVSALSAVTSERVSTARPDVVHLGCGASVAPPGPLGLAVLCGGRF